MGAMFTNVRHKPIVLFSIVILTAACTNSNVVRVFLTQITNIEGPNF